MIFQGKTDFHYYKHKKTHLLVTSSRLLSSKFPVTPRIFCQRSRNVHCCEVKDMPRQNELTFLNCLRGNIRTELRDSSLIPNKRRTNQKDRSLLRPNNRDSSPSFKARCASIITGMLTFIIALQSSLSLSLVRIIAGRENAGSAGTPATHSNAKLFFTSRQRSIMQHDFCQSGTSDHCSSPPTS